MIKVVIKEKNELYNEVCQEYIKSLKENTKLTLGLATGSSPVPLYERLVNSYKKGEVSFENVTTFNLDEYYNIDINDKNSYHAFMKEHLFSKIDVNAKNIFFPPTNENGINGYEENLKNNSIDIQLLGIGSNGHIAFNEPGSSFSSRTRVVDLDEKTINDNSRFFDSIEDVPTQAISMGLANIMEAKKIILIAVGESKADILKEIFANDDISENIPATILKKHPDVTFYVDLDAAKYIK